MEAERKTFIKILYGKVFQLILGNFIFLGSNDPISESLEIMQKYISGEFKELCFLTEVVGYHPHSGELFSFMQGGVQEWQQNTALEDDSFYFWHLELDVRN